MLKHWLLGLSLMAGVVQAADLPHVLLKTSAGNIELELFDDKAPVSSENFLRYVDEGFYNGTVFHRVIPGFMAQAGGFTPDLEQKNTHAPIINEASNGVTNQRGTLAMARTQDPNSATSQFFINVKDNDFLNAGPGSAGYAVFGKVVSGMDVVDQIVQVPTGRKGMMQDIPREPITIIEATRVTESK